MNFSQAIHFVTTHGNSVELSRLRYLLEQTLPSSEVINTLLANQCPDGGWSPFWAQDYSSLDATCYRLAQAEQLGLNDSQASIRKALTFFEQRQKVDGSWQEDESVADFAPPWAMPGDQAATLYLTANCGFWTMFWGKLDSASRAANFLIDNLDAKGQLPSYLHTHWLTGSLLWYTKRNQAAIRIFGFLQTQLGELSASNLAWLMNTLQLAGVASAHPLLAKSAELLTQTQLTEGCWQSEDGADRDVHVTLEAMRVLQYKGVFCQ